MRDPPCHVSYIGWNECWCHKTVALTLHSVGNIGYGGSNGKLKARADSLTCPLAEDCYYYWRIQMRLAEFGGDYEPSVVLTAIGTSTQQLMLLGNATRLSLVLMFFDFLLIQLPVTRLLSTSGGW
jgi:hypothetical protein